MKYWFGQLMVATTSLMLGVTLQPNSASALSLFSVDFGSTVDSSSFTGVEPVAATADPVFNAANQWNTFHLPPFSPVTNPSLNLVDSTGTATSAKFSITGTVSGYSLLPFENFKDSLLNDYLYFNNRGLSSSIDWAISGLAASTTYRFYAYGSISDYLGRQFSLFADTDGDGIDDEAAQTVTSNGLLLTVVTNSSGVLLGRASGIGQPGILSNEANWAGFQLAEVPSTSIPTPALLPGLASLGIAAWRKRKSEQAKPIAETAEM